MRFLLWCIKDLYLDYWKFKSSGEHKICIKFYHFIKYDVLIIMLDFKLNIIFNDYQDWFLLNDPSPFYLIFLAWGESQSPSTHPQCWRWISNVRCLKIDVWFLFFLLTNLNLTSLCCPSQTTPTKNKGELKHLGSASQDQLVLQWGK